MAGSPFSTNAFGNPRNINIRALTALLLAALVAGSVPQSEALAKKRASAPQSTPRPVVEPLTLVISLRQQRIQVFDAQGYVASSSISSGRPGYRTPKGVFTILQKKRQHFSNLYGGASMPNMQRITWSGVALHAGNLPGYPDSHGCIRLPHSFSKYLFGITSMNTRVIVTDDPVTPIPFEHASLLKPLPAGTPEANIQTASLASTPETDPSHTAGMLLGVSPANAAEEPSGGPVTRTRAAIAAARAREMSGLQAELDRSRGELQQIGESLKAANFALRPALEAVKKAETELRSANNQVAAAEAQVAKTQSLLRDFMRKNETINSGEDLAKAASDEDGLEARLLDQIANRELAQRNRDATLALVDERRRASDEAKSKRDELLRRHIEARKVAISASAALDKAKEQAALRDRPVSVLLSKKTGLMYVRQLYDDVLQVPIEFEQPEAPVGTHVFTALSYSPDGDSLSWHAVTAALHKPTSDRKSGKVSKAKDKEQPKVENAANFPPQTPANAIARVKIPDDVRDRLAELLKPGSSIIITDEGKSLETGKYTDLIVEYR